MRHVLLVNGHEDSRNVLRTALEYRGYRVTDVGDSEAALDLVREQCPDVVVLELYLHPLDGQGLIEKLRADEATARVPIVCLTSRVMTADRQSAMNAGADVFLPKPLTPTEVIKQVDQLVGAVPAGE